jgi:hypothetical protein
VKTNCSRESSDILNHRVAKYWDRGQAPNGEREKNIGHLVSITVGDGHGVSVDGSRREELRQKKKVTHIFLNTKFSESYADAPLWHRYSHIIPNFPFVIASRNKCDV